MTGHTSFKSYTWRIEKDANDECVYCGEVDSAKYTIFECTRWVEVRKKVRSDGGCHDERCIRKENGPEDAPRSHKGQGDGGVRETGTRNERGAGRPEGVNQPRKTESFTPAVETTSPIDERGEAGVLVGVAESRVLPCSKGVDKRFHLKISYNLFVLKL